MHFPVSKNYNYLFVQIRIYTNGLRGINPYISEANIDDALDTAFAYWFREYVSPDLH